jgi:hypothetical protein
MRVSTPVAEAILIGLARHAVELAGENALTHEAHAAILSTVAQYTPGISPARREQQFDTVRSTTEILRDVEAGWGVQAVFTATGNEFATSTDIESLADTASEERAEALAKLLDPRLTDQHDTGTCRCVTCTVLRRGRQLAQASA